jgi:hypothetical protein
VIKVEARSFRPEKALPAEVAIIPALSAKRVIAEADKFVTLGIIPPTTARRETLCCE